MPTRRTPLRRASRGTLAFSQEQELWLGICTYPTFESEEERREAWERHRARLMDQFAHNGRRPAAWWTYEAPIPFPGRDVEQSTLFEAGLLGEGEAADLVEWWRSEFERASKPGFSYCQGPGAWQDGAAAREAHYAWADIPRCLLEKWARKKKGPSIMSGAGRSKGSVVDSR